MERRGPGRSASGRVRARGGAPLVGDMARTRRPHEGDEPGRGTRAPSVGTAWGQATASICRKARRGAARSTGRRAGHRPVGGPVCGDVAPAGWTVRRDGTRTAPGTGQRLGRPGGTAGHSPASRKARQDSGPGGRKAGQGSGRSEGAPDTAASNGRHGRTAASPVARAGQRPSSRYSRAALRSVGRRAEGAPDTAPSDGRRGRAGPTTAPRGRSAETGQLDGVAGRLAGWVSGGGAVRGRCAAGPSGVCGRAVRGEGSAGRPAGAADGHDGPTNGKDPLGA